MSKRPQHLLYALLSTAFRYSLKLPECTDPHANLPLLLLRKLAITRSNAIILTVFIKLNTVTVRKS